MSTFLPPLVPSWSGLIPVLGTTGIVSAAWAGSRRRRYLSEDSPSTGLPGIAAAAVLIWMIWSLFYADTIYHYYLPALYHSQWLGAAVAVLAVFLYFVRKRARWFYAVLEIAGAAAAIYVTTAPSNLPFVQRVVAIVGAIYFLIRGLDNADQGGLWKMLRSRSLELRVIIPVISIAGAAATIIFYGADSSQKNPHPFPDPPFALYADKLMRPVSAARCGEPFVTCSEENWRERTRLLAGTEKDRDAAELDADRRFDAYLTRYPHPIAKPTFAAEKIKEQSKDK